MKKVKYLVCIPAGNDTALVLGTDFTKEEKKKINDQIMERQKNVEQTGFIDPNKVPELQMAGGEFCGNATRSAAFIYLKGKEGSMELLVNEKDRILAGVDEKKNAWCEIPLYQGNDVFMKKEDGIYQIRLNGMITIVVEERVAKKFLENRENLKQAGFQMIQKYGLQDSEAVGIMFCEKEEEVVKINPIVWVKEIDTLFYETGCGSGTTAVRNDKSFFRGKKSRN